jgi:hypothetical protein
LAKKYHRVDEYAVTLGQHLVLNFANDRKDLHVAVNLLKNRPADYFRHNGHMSPQQVAWHNEFERKCRESGREGDESDL